MIELSKQQLAIEEFPSTKMVCGLPCGSGKTIGVLAASKGVSKILVVMPKILKQDATWEKNKEKLGTTTEMITISKEQFRKFHKELPKCDCLILDEFASWATGINPTMKSKNCEEYIVTSQMHDAVMWYINEHSPPSIYLLDATASANKPMALWATKRILGTLNSKMSEMESFLRFRQMFYFKYQKGYTALYLEKKDMKTKKTLSDMWKKTGVFFDTEDKIEPIEKVIDIQVTLDQIEIRNEIDDLYSDPLVLRMRHYMACNGSYTRMEFDENNHTSKKERIEIPTNKERWILDLARGKKQFIVFATFTAQINRIRHLLAQNNIKVDIITGSVEDKSIPAEKFRNKEIKVLIVQSSICQGWEAPYCDTIVRASQPNRADHALQQAGRIDRPHIIKKQNYIYNLIVPDSVDEEAYETIKRGEDLHFMTVSGEEE